MKNNVLRGYKKASVILLLLIFVFSLFNMNILFNVERGEVMAATNLIEEGSFEENIDDSWSIWEGDESTRDYEFSRSLEATDFGLGIYSATISATGEANGRWDAGLITKESFPVESGSNYYFVFYAKATQNTSVSIFLENSVNYAGITPGVDKEIGVNWEKNIVMFAPTDSVDALASFAFGDLDEGNTLYLDEVQIFKADISVGTSLLKGYIGDTNKYIQITNLVNFNQEDVEIELPYLNDTNGQTERRRFIPEKITSNRAYINFYSQTYSGIGKVFINDEEIGSFDYTVLPKVVDFFPSLVRADEDLSISGSGFTPSGSNTFLVVNVSDHTGKTVESWIPAHSINYSFTEAMFKLPLGLVTGKMYIYTSYLNMSEEEVSGKSATMAYSVKPIIDHVTWSKKGYEQVGDKLRIYGKGLSAKPYVNFYNEAGEKVDTKAGKLVEIGEYEVIEVDATSVYNKFNIKVMAYGIESDDADAVEYSAKPKLNTISSKYKRFIQSTNAYIQAAKVGEKIKLVGSGFKPTSGNVTVEFQGINERIEVVVLEADIIGKGTGVEIVIPNGAQNGHINVNVNGEKSNYIPLEIIPTVLTINPDPIVPGEDILIAVNGVGSNINLTNVYFSLDKNNQQTVSPSLITFSDDGTAIVTVKAPLALSSQNTIVNLEYDRWVDNGSSVLNVNPVITSASINMDNSILTIKGYGFSTYSRENEITYRYADVDKTIIEPNVRMLGVYPTEEGQEIRIQILDEYHYGYVQLKVGDLESAEVNFGPVSIAKISRRVEFVKTADTSDSEDAGSVMGVVYINGYNFGTAGGVKIGDNWADVHYRTNFFIIAVLDEQYVYDNPVIITKE